MSHEVESMVSARDVPWHGLGNVVDGVMTADEALVQAGLDWRVNLVPLFARYAPDPDIEGIESPVFDLAVDGQFATVRDRDMKVLGTVGSQYVPIQNTECFDFFDNLVDSGEAKYETAGSLRGGKIVFICAKVPQSIMVAGIDPVDLYLVLYTSHDGSKKLSTMVTPVRTVCMNTLNYGVSSAKQSWSTKHTRSATDKFVEARRTMDLTFKYVGEFQAEAERMIEAVYTMDEFEALTEVLFPSNSDLDKRRSLIGTLERSRTIDDTFRYTRWGAMQAVSEWADWIRPTRQRGDKSDAERATEAAWFGPNVVLKQAAHKVLAIA